MGSQAMIFVILGLSFAAWVDCNSEGDILFAQKKAWKDPNNVLQTWDPTKINPCTWFHVTCNTDNSVIRIDLGDAGLSGPLIPQLGKLVNLQYIELYANNINGTIPKELGNLKSLVSLDIQQNLLTGTIPSSLGNLKYLRFLRLSENMLTGNIPTEVLNLIRFGNFIVLNVSRNNMDGTVTRSKKTGFAISIVVQDQKAT